ncbi:MAG TPA: response regulator [Blastocatellia bacterium]|nr:response regulator [Blastocatellia bacterium]
MGKSAILIVEDNDDIRIPVGITLEQEGFTVFSARDCNTAFDFMAREQPDIILTDLLMPEMTGLEFIRQVRRTAGYSEVPIIAMSAYDKSYLAAALLAGANAALHKPEDMDNLIDTIREVLRNSNNGNGSINISGMAANTFSMD